VTDLHHELLIAGFGGQGVVLAGKLLASAALAEGREVVWAPSYGPEMRGGAVHCTVIVSSGRIGSPEISQADSLLIMDQTSLPKFFPRLKPGGLLLLNSSLIADAPTPPDSDVLLLPATEAAATLGNARVANVIMLGAFLAVRPIVSLDSLAAAMTKTAQEIGAERLLPMNLQALARGAELARS
jgi:2-oxoglutarate ferredoxin oxidoreductase subunit gamma